MKKILIMGTLAALASGNVGATVLFPFFGDLAPESDVKVRLVDDNKFEQIVYKGDSGWGGLAACESFMDDVVPEDVTKHGDGKNIVVYTSPFREKEIDTIKDDNKISAVYIVDRGDRVEIYYSESSDIQQKEWESDITAGNL